MKNEIEGFIRESIKCKEDFLGQSENLSSAIEIILECLNNHGKILIFGNGGSAADAQHMAAELSGRYKIDRKGLPAMALTTDTSVLTAVANDYDFSDVFSRQVIALAKEGDVLVGISTSGNSKNVVNALKNGKEIGTKNITLTGNDGGEMKGLSDVNINSDSDNTPRIQECHMIAYHSICEVVEKEMFK
tara:strand:- start:13765 stop:14331 length:567 start_codon:yes stop_codon:yes gene_type:complete